MQVLRARGEYLTTRHNRARSRLLRIATSAYRRYQRLRSGSRGTTVISELLRSLGDEYLLINDVILPGHPGKIDHVLIGPCGVVVIETKNFSGVESHGRVWLVNGRRHRRSSRQVQDAAMAVKETLARVHPELKDSVLRSVDSIAVFTNPVSRVKVVRASNVAVVRYSQLLDVILAKARRKKVPADV